MSKKPGICHGFHNKLYTITFIQDSLKLVFLYRIFNTLFCCIHLVCDCFRFFRAEMGFYVNEARRTLNGKGSAATKKLAAQDCSLSIVRQLYHMGAIEMAEAGQVQCKKRKTDEVCGFLYFCSKYHYFVEWLL